MRQRRLTIATAALVAGIIVLAAAPSTLAAPTSTRVDIVKVSGLIDPLNADLVSHSVDAAVSQHALVLVIQLNSTGGTVAPREVDALTSKIAHSPVPVAVWVGGSSRPRAYGPAFAIARAAAFTGEAPGSRVGAGRTMSGDDAVDAGVLNVAAPTLVAFLGALASNPFRGGPVRLGTVGANGEPQFRKDITFNFSQLSIVPKLMHTAASPDVAFVMLVIALSLFVFEFFTAGVGVAAGTGIVFGVLAVYGLGVLPTRPVSAALVAGAILAFAVDVQAGAPRVWSVVGLCAYVAGALLLYDGQSVSLWVVVLMGILLGLFMVNGMPAMVRTRFSTPTIGREAMIGELGVSVSGVDPEGTVKIHGAPWRARTNRATPIEAGEIVRVIAIDGLLLEVEPESGGARDAHH